MRTFLPLLKIEMIQTRRNWVGFIMGIGMPIAFFLFFSGIYQFDSEEIKIRAIKQMMISLTAFSSVSFSFFSFPYSFQEDRQSDWQIRLVHSPVPLWQYYFVRVLRIVFSFVIAIAAVFTVGALVRGISMPWTDWLAAFSLLLVGSTFFLGFGMLLTLIKSAELLSAVGNILYLGLAMLGGMWFPVELFPKWMQKLSELTPTYHLVYLVNIFVKEGAFAGKSLLILALYAIMGVAVTLVIKRRMEVDL